MYRPAHNGTVIVAALLVFFLAGKHSDDGNGRSLNIQGILTLGHKYTAWFYSDALDSLLSCFVGREQAVREIRQLRQKVDKQFGRETELLNERTGRSIGKSNRYYYIRYSKFSKISQPVKTESSFDGSDRVFQFSVEVLPQEAAAKLLDYRTKATLRLPFNGLWYVAAGGLNINTNHHAVSTDQRYAYDFMIKKDGFIFQNDGTRNEDYFCYNGEIVSPGAGSIVEVVNTIDENKPGEWTSGAGNYIIIDHGSSEFSILAHLKRGSIAVTPGEKVQIGQFLGLSGNSGHAAMPHLHYHLQNSPRLFAGEGLPIRFRSYLADGKEIRYGEPLWNQYVMNK
jgi:hypothetical protein